MLQRNLDRLESWEIAKCMKFNKSKCWILHHTYKLGEKRVENNLAERDLDRLGCGEVEYVSTAV